MTDFSIDSSRTEPRIDTRWRTSKFGQEHAQPGQLDLTKFTAGTHYNIGSRKDNVIPSGVAVKFNATSKMYEPWAAADTEPLAGFINDDSGIDLYRRNGVAISVKSTFALLTVGQIDAGLLPIAAQRTTVAAATTTGLFTYV